MPQRRLKSLCAANKTRHSQINKQISLTNMTRQFYGANVDFMKTIKFLEKQPSTLLNRFPAVLPGKYRRPPPGRCRNLRILWDLEREEFTQIHRYHRWNLMVRPWHGFPSLERPFLKNSSIVDL